jgi:putative phage-type endonuclease
MSALVQGTPEWLELRKSCIGASDMPIIMGDSPWTTPLQLWKQKVGLAENTIITSSMQRGLDLEDIARQQFNRITLFEMTPTVIFHSEYPWLMASLDGAHYHLGILTHILEIKCASKIDHALAKKGKIPKKYYAQLQTQLAVTNLKMAYYFSFDGEKGVIVEVKRDDIYIERLIEKALDFKRYMDQFIPPELTEIEKRESECQYIENVDAEKAAERYFELGEMIDQLTEQREHYKSILINSGGGSDVQGRGFKLSKMIRKGAIDYDSILEHFEIDTDLELHRKPSTQSWRIVKMEENEGHD